MERLLARQRARQAALRIPLEHRQGRILDVGCGSTPYFLMHTTFSEKYGLERTPQAVASSHDVRLIAHDLEEGVDLPFKDETFDVVTMLAVLEHLEPEAIAPLLDEIYRVMRPQGILVVTTPASWTSPLLSVLATTRLVSPIEINEHKAAYSQGRLRELVESSAFRGSRVDLGYFELGMNIWATAAKTSVRRVLTHTDRPTDAR